MPYILKVIVGALNSIFDMIILMIYLKTILKDRKEYVPNWFYYVAFLVVCGVEYGIGWFPSLWIIHMFGSIIGIFLLTFLYKTFY